VTEQIPLTNSIARSAVAPGWQESTRLRSGLVVGAPGRSVRRMAEVILI